MLGKIEQAVASAGAGECLDFAEQQAQCVDVPALRAQAIAALAQRLQTFRQVTQERASQLCCLLCLVVLLHANPGFRHYTSASTKREVCASTDWLQRIYP